MSGADQRGTVHIEGLDPADVIEEEPGVNLSFHRAYHVGVDIYSAFSVDVSSPINRNVQIGVESIFKVRGDSA